MEAYVDPAASNTLTILLQIRRWVAERPGEVGVNVHLTHAGIKPDPRAHRARLWLASMASEGLLLPALRTTRRDGTDRLFVRLSTAAGRAELAKELGLDATAHERIAMRRCYDAQFEVVRSTINDHRKEHGTGAVRLPAFSIDDLLFEDAGLLDRVRPAASRRQTRARKASLRPSPWTPSQRTASATLRRPQVRGVSLGGPGLRHTFLLSARDEDDPVLYTLLPPVLAYRREHPGELTVRVVARGLALEHGLRQRLCEAQRRGLAPAYLQALAQEPSVRHANPATTDLLEALDAPSSASACDVSLDDDEEALPDAAMLDGFAVSRAELEHLGDLLEILRATNRPLGGWLSPALEADDF